jgi:hypothetical protein
VSGTVATAVALCPEATVDQGDPFLLEVPAAERSLRRFRFYVYVTDAGFPVYGADDLLDPSGWRRVGDSYPGIGIEPWCWAPCVRYVAGLARPWVMLYSRADGAGDPEGHQGHTILRADSISPEGPFADSGEVLTAGLDFAIDPDVHTRTDGSNWLLFATDFVDDEPYGTGLAHARISPDLRGLLSEPSVIARPSAPWQVFDSRRSMPWKTIPGIDWGRGDTVAWSTIEGPAATTSPGGREIVLYSGGNFTDFYGVGVIAQDEAGGWTDLSRSPAEAVLSPQPQAGLFGPGHCSVLSSEGQTYMCFHFRAEAAALRQFAVVPLDWDMRTDLPHVRWSDRN